MICCVIPFPFPSDARCNLNVQLGGDDFPIGNKSGVGIATEDIEASLIRLRGILLEVKILFHLKGLLLL